MATAREKNDPYIPMDAALAQPAPLDAAAEPIHVGPVTLRSLFRTWGRVLKKHFWWGVALMAAPTIASNASVLLDAVSLLFPALGVSPDSAETIGTAVLFLLALPLQLGASGALVWRLVGSGDHGPLRRGPMAGLFLGFRFAGVQFVYGFFLGIVCLPLVIPSTLIYFLTLTENGLPIPLAQEPTGWIVFAAVSVAAAALVVYFTARWAIGAEIAVARNVEVSSALKQSSARVKLRMRTVFAFVGINLLVTTVPVYALSWGGSVVGFFGIEASYGAIAGSIASILASLLAAVLSPAAHAALYFALTAGEKVTAPEATGDPTDPTDPTDRSELQETL